MSYKLDKHKIVFRTVCTVNETVYVDVLDENGDVMEYGLTLLLAKEKYHA